MIPPATHRRLRWLRSRKGAILILAAVGMVILLAAAAFSVDIAYMQLTREELHISTDAAAKAAVAKLSLGGTEDEAKQAGVDCAAANTVAGKPLVIAKSDITLGKVNYSDNGHWPFDPNGTPKTAAKVNVTMSSGTSSGAVSLFFGKALGTPYFNPSSTSIAAFVRNKVCLVLDRSGSMRYDLSGYDRYPAGVVVPTGCDADEVPPHATDSRWAKLAMAIDTFLTVVESVPVETKVGLITWSSQSRKGDWWSQHKVGVWPNRVTHPASPAVPATTLECTFTTDFSLIRTPITNLSNNPMYGYTNMSAGMDEGIDLFATTDDGTPWNKVMILFSDGQWNRGSDPVLSAQTAKANNIVVHTVGLLTDAGNTALQDIAALTGGRYYRATTAAELNAAFQEIARLLPVILTQ